MGLFGKQKKKPKTTLKNDYQLWKLRARRIVQQKVKEDGATGAVVKFFIAPIITIIAIFVIYLIP